jgi:RNA polymerase sigma-70 factor (ECF subfamily)
MSSLLDILFRRHSKELLSFASLRVGNAAEDLVQEAYLRLLQHPDPASIENLRSFLYRTTSNLTIDHHRRRQLELRYHYEPALDIERDSEIVKVIAATPCPEKHLSQQQELDLIRKMLQELPEITRHVFILIKIEGLSHPEVAMRLGISVRSCGRHLAEALGHLLKHQSFDELGYPLHR